MDNLPSLKELLTGSILSGADDSAAQKYLNQQTGAFNGLTAPDLQKVQLQQQQWGGDVTPQTVQGSGQVQFGDVDPTLASVSQQGQSALSNISTDPRLAEAQMASLSGLQQLAAKGGMNAADTANLQNIQNQSAQADKGRRDAILQNMSERGMGGSGAEELAQLASSQAATDQQNQQGLNVAGMAQQRALQALTQGGSLAGQIQQQQFGQQAQQAQAQDAINRFNTANSNQGSQYNAGVQNQMGQYNAGNDYNAASSNRQYNTGVDQYNAGVNNQATYYNNAGRQGVSNADTGTANQQTMYNDNTLPTQNYGFKEGLARDKSGAAGVGTSYYSGQSTQDRTAATNAMQGAIGAGTQGATNYSNTGSPLTSAKDASMMAGMAHGGLIPGHAMVPGDSPLNDTQLTPTSPGEMILPRTVVQAPHPMQAIKSFMDKLKNHSGAALAVPPPGGSDAVGGLLAKLPKPAPAASASGSKEMEMAALKQLLKKFSSGQVG